jgi:hypothetical protein
LDEIAAAAANPPPKKKVKKSLKTVLSGAAAPTLEALMKWKPPCNGTHYDLNELVSYMLIHSESPIFKMSAEKVHKLLRGPGCVVCGRSTIEKWCTVFRNGGGLPRPGQMVLQLLDLLWLPRMTFLL